MGSAALHDISHVTNWFSRPLIVIGYAEISIVKIVIIILSVSLIVSAAKFLKRMLVGRLLVNSVHDQGTRGRPLAPFCNT
jgi:small-conductance mechanosensitive channel